MGIRVGLPQGLLFYQHGEVWAEFLRQLGAEVVLSGQTTRRTLDLGGVLAEVCLPVKVYFGHVCALYNQVDYLFVPRMVSETKGKYNCPEMIGIPDMIRSNLSQMPPLLDVLVSSAQRQGQMWQAVIETGRRLGVGLTASLMAWHRACCLRQSAQGLTSQKVSPIYSLSRLSPTSTLETVQKGSDARKVEDVRETVRLQGTSKRAPADLTTQMGPFQRSPLVALIGHAYILYDPQVSMNVIAKLERQGLRVVTPRMVPARDAARGARVFGKEIFWTYSHHMAGAAIALMQAPLPVDGVIFMTSFSCGPDALIGELIQQYAQSCRIPCMTLSMDEHTAEAGFDTRVEAFADMLMLRWQP
ncbi:acyl-CoA dehydratase activase-related protein [Acetonema longum]|uniref:DUF2229 domain-containing protein n=1 Tax=Acetonema longum DSM 6540 TaxID=1009370 RepID=F7NQG9_9FIRM|nr:acyl-CoA dehydratase activase-related protein [Acetonema longum]EGO61747.1 hypothetical protein ALO_21841 [Acetonema longum DSM 6540]